MWTDSERRELIALVRACDEIKRRLHALWRRYDERTGHTPPP